LAAADSACEGGICCSHYANPKQSAAGGFCQLAASPSNAKCVQASAGNDLIDGSALAGVGIHGRQGNDSIIGTAGDDVLNGGEGNDVICGSRPGLNEGTDLLVGGDGDDIIATFGGTNHVWPGSGKDTIRLRGTDDIFIADGCEVVTGETYTNLQGGTKKVFSAYTRQQLEQFGATFEGAFEFSVLEGNNCFATCGGNAGCGLNQGCSYNQGVATCSDIMTSLGPAMPPATPPNYPNVAADIKDLLASYHSARTRTEYIEALDALRARATDIIPAVVTEFSQAPTRFSEWRLTQVQILAYLDVASALPELKTIALAAVQRGPEYDHMNSPYQDRLLEQAMAITGLRRLSELTLASADRALEDIMTSAATDSTRTAAAVAYLDSYRDENREQIARQKLPSRLHHIVSAQIKTYGFPAPPASLRGN